MQAKEIEIEGMPTYYVCPEEGIRGSLIIIHEIWGLVDHIKNVAFRFAGEGYTVLAPNLLYDLSIEGMADQRILERLNDPEQRDEAQKEMRALLAPIQAPGFAERTLTNLRQCVDYLTPICNGKIGVLGFCFGGTYSFALASADSRIRAAVPFYGQPPATEQISAIMCPVLAFYGEKDTNLMETLPSLKENMAHQDKLFSAIVYPDTGYAFFNDTNTRMYNAPAAQDAWEKSIAFLENYLS